MRPLQPLTTQVALVIALSLNHLHTTARFQCIHDGSAQSIYRSCISFQPPDIDQTWITEAVTFKNRLNI